MNRLLILIAFVSGCGFAHLGQLDGGEGEGGNDHVLVIVDDGGDSQADVRMVIDDGGDGGSDAAPVDPDAIVADSGTDAGSDAGQDAGSDTGTDAGTDAGTDSGTDAGQDVTPTCATNETWCGSSCETQHFSPDSCGDCAPTTCGSNQICERSPQDRPTCCSVVLTLTDGSVGHCPAGSCDGGHCLAEVGGFNIVNWYCCPATP